MAKNKLSDLRNHLFEALEKLTDNEIEPAQARAVSDVAQTIINSARLELDYLKLVEGRDAQFFDGTFTLGAGSKPDAE